ncbi:MAG: YraN family protein [Vicinamibacterales bacterium]
MPDRVIDAHAHGLGLVIDHYDRLGYDVVARVARTRFGSIDLVVFNERSRVLVFASASTSRPGAVKSSVAATPAQRRIRRRQAVAWLASAPTRPHARELRFDTLHVVVDDLGGLVELGHIEGAA